MVKTLLTKISENGEYHYSLVQFSNKYVIYRAKKNQSIQTQREADFEEMMSEFSDETKARDFFEKI